jgi:hypothetical protein
VDEREARHLLISLLLQAEEPVGAGEVAARAGVPEGEAGPLLTDLVDEGLVASGRLLPDGPAPLYRWGARWEQEARRRAEAQRRALKALVDPLAAGGPDDPDVHSDAAVAFYDYVTGDYQPPGEKRFLVVLQCSVRRPFSKSPSHASMRRAIAVATGFDPSEDSHTCPVHVVVLASKLGPVPYELEDVHPANVRGGGVKHFSPRYYEQVRPVLASRMAGYLIAHRECYRHVAAFTDGRYGEVMEDVRATGVVDFPILPDAGGPAVTRMGESYPRKYWEKHWIQLYECVTGWLGPAARERAGPRRRERDVVHT